MPTSVKPSQDVVAAPSPNGPTVGVGIIVKDEACVKDCVESFIEHVDQIVVVTQTDTPQTLKDVLAAMPKVAVYDFGDWIDDFAAKRNFSFSKLTTDWMLWVDSDDVVYQPDNLRKIASTVPEQVGCIWFPYHYAIDEFGNITTMYERERLLRRSQAWIWTGRIHETVSPMKPCQYMRSDVVIIRHDHRGGRSRNDRNFRILDIMFKENPNDKRIWLYLGHQHFAAGHWMVAADWYLKFGTDTGAVPLERYQSLCYCAKALREMADFDQSIAVALNAVNLCPEYKDAYMEAAQGYLRKGDYDKAILYANLSDVHELIKEPPALIFINPLEYGFNRYPLLADAYLRKNDLKEALKWAQKALEFRPTEQLKSHAAMITEAIRREDISRGIKALAVDLLDNKELVKLPHLMHATPHWWRDTDDYVGLKAGVAHHTKDMQSKPEIVESGKSVTVNVARAVDLKELLDDLDKKFDTITITCPRQCEGQINVLTIGDMEALVLTSPGRHVINLREDDKRVWCEYDKKSPEKLSIRMFLGQGLETWNPKTINEVGSGGSELWAASMAKELAKKDCQPIVYAMDNQVWDGVLYRHFSKYNPDSIMSHLFISSRIPEVFNADIKANQKWLWCHDISFFERLTPDIASKLDAIVCVSQWQADHLQRAYPWLLGCEVMVFDNNPQTYVDAWTPQVYESDLPLTHKPVLAVIGHGLDSERFTEGCFPPTKVHSFIWASSPDRGLEELLVMWPMIMDKWPNAELNIFYGWEYFNSSLGIPAQREFKERIRTLLEQPGVKWRGRVGQRDMAIEMQAAQYWLYPPHEFRETYCITALEAQAAGVLCFYRTNGALGETIGDRGIPIPMDATQEQIVSLVTDENCDYATMRQKAKQYALSRTWEGQAAKLLLLYEAIEDAKNRRNQGHGPANR